MENKKSFILYSDSQSLINQLPDDVAGRLFKHIYAYVNDEYPTSEELLLNIAFEPIKMQLKRDLQKWEQTLDGRSKAGKASAEAKRLAKLNQQNLTNSTNVDYVQQSSTNSTVNDNVNVNVNDNDNIYIDKPMLIEIKPQYNNLQNTQPLNIDTEYYNQFLEKWNLYGQKYKDRKVELKNLTIFDKQNLKHINLPITEISKALFILFNQNEIIESCLVTPKHFLVDFYKYYQAGLECAKTGKVIQFYKKNN